MNANSLNNFHDTVFENNLLLEANNNALSFHVDSSSSSMIIDNPDEVANDGSNSCQECDDEEGIVREIDVYESKSVIERIAAALEDSDSSSDHDVMTFDIIRKIVLEEQASGLHWIVRNNDLAGKELVNEELAASLRTKHTFTKEEWDQFKIDNLRCNNYIKVGNEYMIPLDPTNFEEETQTQIPITYEPNAEMKKIASKLLIELHITYEHSKGRAKVLSTIADDFHLRFVSFYKKYVYDNPIDTRGKQKLMQLIYAMRFEIENSIYFTQDQVKLDKTEYLTRQNTILRKTGGHPCGAAVLGLCNSQATTKEKEEHMYARRKAGKHFYQEYNSPSTSRSKVNFACANTWKTDLQSAMKACIILLCHDCSQKKTIVHLDNRPDKPCGCLVCKKSVAFRWFSPDFPAPDPLLKSNTSWKLYSDGTYQVI